MAILGSKHTHTVAILGPPELRQALEGKALITVLSGKRTRATLSAVVGEAVLGDAKEHSSITRGRTMVNLAAREGASVTTMAASTCQSNQQAINVAK